MNQFKTKAATPRTNKAKVGTIGFYSCATVPASLAEQLESELSTAVIALKSVAVNLSLAEKLGYDLGPYGRLAKTASETALRDLTPKNPFSKPEKEEVLV